TGIEYGLAQYHGARVLLRDLHELGYQVGRMLAIRIHGQRIGKTLRSRLIQSAQYGGSLADVLWKNDDAQAAILLRQFAQTFRRVIGTAVHDHPYRIPVTTGFPDRVIDFRPGVIAGDKYQMG